MGFHDVAGFGPGRGVSVAVLHEDTGEVEEIEVFDTWLSSELSSRLAAEFVESVVPGRLVMVAVADANYLSRYPETVDVFESQLGSQFAGSADFRDTWAMVRRKGQVPSLAEDWMPYTYETGWLPAAVAGRGRIPTRCAGPASDRPAPRVAPERCRPQEPPPKPRRPPAQATPDPRG